MQPIARPIGDGGVSTISSAAGRKASSSRAAAGCALGKGELTLPAGRTGSADFMEACLQAVERGVAAAGADQLVVGAVLDDAAALDGDDAVGHAHASTAGGR